MVSIASLCGYYCCFCLLAFANADIHPIVRTRLGAIQGSTLESRLGIPFLAFRGVRYAKSPTGTLRFKVIKCLSVPLCCSFLIFECNLCA